MAERDKKTGRFPPRPGKPANGPGWGGDAKGASESRFTPETAAMIRALADDPQNKAAKTHFRHVSLTTWVDVALNSDNDGHRNVAAEKIAERAGFPREPVVNVNLNKSDLDDLTDEQLDAEIARLQRAVGGGAAGEGKAPAGEQAGGVPALPETK